jgi:aminoglycoside phosphotransferase (APT) family kinase protein
MAGRNMPAAEVDLTPELIEALVSEQHPDLSGLAVVELANGWDNVMFRLGDRLVVRVPRREVAARLIEHEHAVLPMLAERLPIAIPAPIRSGRPSDALAYPWSWSIVPWIPGTIAATTPFAHPAVEAERLGLFLRALHRSAPADAPPNPYRGHFVGENTAILTERVEVLRGTSGFDADAVLDRWAELVDVAPDSAEPRWIHGDLHAANMLVDDGVINGIIDFGDVCAGDPATDLASAWGVFATPELRGIVRVHAGAVDDAMWRRAEAWALHFAVVYLVHAADSPTMGAIGRRLLDSLLPSPAA